MRTSHVTLGLSWHFSLKRERPVSSPIDRNAVSQLPLVLLQHRSSWHLGCLWLQEGCASPSRQPVSICRRRQMQRQQENLAATPSTFTLARACIFERQHATGSVSPSSFPIALYKNTQPNKKTLLEKSLETQKD